MSSDSDYYFDAVTAGGACAFVEKHIRHVKGEFAGQTIQLMDWQKDILKQIFGWKHIKTGLRKYRTVYIEVPRKNAKSTLSAAIALILLFLDKEPGAEIYCLDPNTKVLKSDLTWDKIKNIIPGDKLIGLDEKSKKGTYRKMRESEVLNKFSKKGPAYKLILDNGKELICSPNHRWMCRNERGGTIRWLNTETIKQGHRIAFIGKPWGFDRSYKSGYLAAAMDGEGSFHSPLKKKAAIRMQFAQRPGKMLNRFKEYLSQKGFNFREYKHYKTDIEFIEIGGLYNVLRFLGQFNPVRLIAKSKDIWNGKATNKAIDWIKVIDKIELYDRELIDIETSTKTFFADGFISHNSAAGDRGQAGIVFDIAKQMVLQDKTLSKRADIYKNSIMHGFSYYHAISKDSNTKHGFNAHGVIFDELHTQKNRDLWDTLNTSTGSRRQPLTVAITTAGHDMNSICREIHDIAVDIIEGKREDPAFLPIIYAADVNDDIYSEETWKKANPGWGQTLKPEYIIAEAQRAKMSPSYENTFKRLHLNLWTQAKDRWIRDEVWNASGKKFDPAILDGRECWGGLDLSSVSDLSAFALIFPIEGKIYSLNWFWLPEEKAKHSADKNNLNYIKWVKQGYIIENPGNVIDYDHIEGWIIRLSRLYSIQSIAYDPYNSTGIVSKLGAEGFQMEKFRQGFISMNYPMRQLERVIMAGEFYHNDNPVLAWMAGAVEVALDSTGNQKISRGAYDKKVDGIVANVMAYGQYLAEQEQGGSYLTEGGVVGI